ncbi:Predicted nucleic-acid-binding protein containing a Zn-ribbon [Bordetella ansorpii]|uniref:Predicted nucleic-acid-binding protein containing a Zn-ribbon n=1 Tax=Bordetella ansorpii TaxID=288768 RepID=A0A157S663_9BORD|nr:OB-fold domain-containing protein [Bordetella ansorpii]SAI65869.1 Predicted nucleic-acid-binding protein containing a Zn-ribbon [Bordetella ansorpii]
MSHAESRAPVGVEQQYFAFLAQGQWRVPRCTLCGLTVFYPRQICPACSHDQFDWITPSGRGVVHATTTVRRPPKAGGDSNVSLIDLEEGFRMMSRVEHTAPGEVRIGDQVVARVQDVDGVALVVFDLHAKETAQ